MSVGLLNAEMTVVNVARSYRWVRETQGPNRGEAVDAIIRVTGLQPPQSWCAAFVAYVGKAALAEKWPLKPWASCDKLFEEAVALKMVTTVPVRGAIFGLWKPGELFYHVGFVDGLDPSGAWRTCEGNSNDDGSANGDGVYVRLRKFGANDRFITWWV